MEWPETSAGRDKQPEERSRQGLQGGENSEWRGTSSERHREQGRQPLGGSRLAVLVSKQLALYCWSHIFFLSVNYCKACSTVLPLRTLLAKVWLLFRCYPARHKFPLLLKCLPPSPVLHNNLDHLRGTYLHINRWHQIPLGQLSILPPNWKVTSADNEQQWTHFCMHLC